MDTVIKILFLHVESATEKIISVPAKISSVEMALIIQTMVRNGHIVSDITTTDWLNDEQS